MEPKERSTQGVALRERVQAVLDEFHGKTAEITTAGRENMRTVNRLSRLIALRHVATDKTFRHNIARYRSEALAEDILIGARRAGQGAWTLVAELVARGDSRPQDSPGRRREEEQGGGQA